MHTILYLLIHTISFSLEIGEIAPDFTLKDQNKKSIRFSDLLGDRNIVVFFYPRDFTFFGKQFLTSFQNYAHKFAKQNALLMGINAASVRTHKNSISKLNLTFSLLSDKGKTVQHDWNISSSTLLSPCITFVFTPNGTLVWMYSSYIFPHLHARKAYKIVSHLKMIQTGKEDRPTFETRSTNTTIYSSSIKHPSDFLPLREDSRPINLREEEKEFRILFAGLSQADEHNNNSYQTLVERKGEDIVNYDYGAYKGDKDGEEEREEDHDEF